MFTAHGNVKYIAHAINRYSPKTPYYARNYIGLIFSSRMSRTDLKLFDSYEEAFDYIKRYCEAYNDNFQEFSVKLMDVDTKEIYDI